MCRWGGRRATLDTLIAFLLACGLGVIAGNAFGILTLTRKGRGMLLGLVLLPLWLLVVLWLGEAGYLAH